MKKGEIIKFGDLKIGDYFYDGENQIFQKLPEEIIDLTCIDIPITKLNALHIQSHDKYSFKSNEEAYFLKHSKYNKNDRRYPSIEESELEHKIEFFRIYLKNLKASIFEMENNLPFSIMGEAIGENEIEDLHNLFNSSLFISIYCYLEEWLDRQCKKIEKENPELDFSQINFRDSGISRSKSFLKKVAKCSFDFGSSTSWCEIKKYNLVRNCIVHNGGIINNKLLQEYVQSNKNLFEQKSFYGDLLVIGDEFCEEVLNRIYWFLRSFLFHLEADKIN